MNGKEVTQAERKSKVAIIFRDAASIRAPLLCSRRDTKGTVAEDLKMMVEGPPYIWSSNHSSNNKNNENDSE